MNYLCGMPKKLIPNVKTKIVKDWSKRLGDITISNQSFQGKLRIKNIRKYSYAHEVDIVMEGKIFVKIGTKLTRSWYGPEVLTGGQYRISKVKLNRFLRKNAIELVKHRLRYFGIEMRHYSEIKKIEWI